MKYKHSLLIAVLCAATAIAPITSYAQTSPAGAATTSRTADDRDDDDDTDFGWIGLLGLLGLAGLMRKKNDNHRHDTTVGHTR